MINTLRILSGQIIQLKRAIFFLSFGKHPPMSNLENIHAVFDMIRKDHQSGSGTLQEHLMDFLLTYLIDAPDFTEKEVKELDSMLTWFRNEMKDFAIISHFTGHLISQLPDGDGLSSADLYDIILAYRIKWQHVNERIIKKFLEKVSLYDKEILLHSQSSVVLDLFRHFSKGKHSATLIQTESRPMLEGRTQAKYLAGLGYEVLFVTDTGFSSLLHETDMVILGADRILPDIFINKTGSHAIASLSRRHGVPVYVLADSRKFYHAKGNEDQNTLFKEDKKPPGEIWKKPPKRVTPVNYYFESIPNDLITAFVTESHFIPGKEMPYIAIEER